MNPHFVLFADGYATGLMHAQWYAQGGSAGLPRGLKLIENGRPTEDFTRIWRATFPTREPLPDVVAKPDGTPTLRFLEVFR